MNALSIILNYNSSQSDIQYKIVIYYLKAFLRLATDHNDRIIFCFVRVVVTIRLFYLHHWRRLSIKSRQNVDAATAAAATAQ